MSALSQDGNTISDCRLWDSNWIDRNNLMPLDPKKANTGRYRLI